MQGISVIRTQVLFSFVILQIIFGSHAQAQTISANGSVSRTGVSGYAGSVTTRQPALGGFLYGITTDERDDSPCMMDLHWWRTDSSASVETFVTTFKTDDCNSNQTGDKSVIFGAAQHSKTAVTELQVCNNKRSNHRLKGIELTAQTIDVSGLSGRYAIEFERTNCSDWDNTVVCPAGRVAVGVDIHTQSDSITGLALVCATPVVESWQLSGSLFYNDVRTSGSFSERLTPTGAIGAESTGSSPSNYLAARGVVVELFRVAAGCVPEKVGSATVGKSGNFSFTWSGGGSCGSNPGVAAVAQLRFCSYSGAIETDRCLSLRDPEDNIYSVAWNNASFQNPTLITGNNINLGRKNFETVAGGLTPTDDWAQAVNLYASLWDASYYFYVDTNISFKYPLYGEVVLSYPEDRKVCSAFGASRIKCPRQGTEDNPKRVNGVGPLHELGHIIHSRAWDGTTGDCGDCPGGQYARNETEEDDPSWGPNDLEYPHAAFQEGWANFFVKAVVGTCDDADFDLNSLKPPLPSDRATPLYGKGYPVNVTKFLCDWLDHIDDNEKKREGNGDYFNGSIEGIHSVLAGMWHNTKKKKDRKGLHICDFAQEFVNASPHLRVTIRDLARQNGLGCVFTE